MNDGLCREVGRKSATNMAGHRSKYLSSMEER
jgi:hypothetical protein